MTISNTRVPYLATLPNEITTMIIREVMASAVDEAKQEHAGIENWGMKYAAYTAAAGKAAAIRGVCRSFYDNSGKVLQENPLIAEIYFYEALEKLKAHPPGEFGTGVRRLLAQQEFLYLQSDVIARFSPEKRLIFLVALKEVGPLKLKKLIVVHYCDRSPDSEEANFISRVLTCEFLRIVRQWSKCKPDLPVDLEIDWEERDSGFLKILGTEVDLAWDNEDGGFLTLLDRFDNDHEFDWEDWEGNVLDSLGNGRNSFGNVNVRSISFNYVNQSAMTAIAEAMEGGCCLRKAEIHACIGECLTMFANALIASKSRVEAIAWSEYEDERVDSNDPAHALLLANEFSRLITKEDSPLVHLSFQPVFNGIPVELPAFISVEGAKVLSAAFGHSNSRLETVDLNRTGLTAEGVGAILEAAANAQSLKLLNLKHLDRNYPSDIEQKIDEIKKANPDLEIRIGDQELDEEIDF